MVFLGPKRGSEVTWPPVGALMVEISMDAEVVAWRGGLLSWLEVWHVTEMFFVVLSMGFALGYYYAKRQNERASVLQRQKALLTDVPEKASVPERARSIPSALIRCEYCTDDVNPAIFPYKRCSGCGATPSYHHGRCCPVKKNKEGMIAKRECSCRSIATQSQCTYKRKLLTPRFLLLPELADGVSDISFSHTD